MRILRRFLAGGLAATTLAVGTPAVYSQPPRLDAPKPAPPAPKDVPPPRPGGPGPKDGPGPDGPKHLADLRRTYDLLADTAPPPRPPGKKDDPAADGRRLHDAARKLYREAVKANDGDGPPAPELTAAAHDAARGLKHFIVATRPADPDLPRPPAGPRDVDSWEPARGELRRAKERLDDQEADGGSAGKEFRDAAKKAYTAGREAYEAKEYDKAAELARAAEAWSHVGEHLDRARDGKDDKSPPPEPRKGERPPPDRRKDDRPVPPPPTERPDPKAKSEAGGKDVPPPPPPLDDKGPKPPRSDRRE